MELRYHTPLGPEEQLAQGLSEPQRLALADKVRFGELDTLNHVNNKAYMGWFESLRVEYFHHFVNAHFGAGMRPRSVLRNVEIRFVKEMVIGESYIATMQISSFRTTSFALVQQIWSGDLRASLTGVMVLLSPDGSRRTPLPDALRRQFETEDGARPEA